MEPHRGISALIERDRRKFASSLRRQSVQTGEGRGGNGSPQILNLSAPQFWTSQPAELLGSKGLLFKLCCVCVSRSQSCLTCCKPMDCSPPGYTVHAILLAIKLEKVAIPFPRVSSRPRD